MATTSAVLLPSNGGSSTSNHVNGRESSRNDANVKVAKPSSPMNNVDIGEWQWLFSASDMEYTPSVLQSGLTPKEERANRWKGAQLIFRIGDYMRLGNHVTTTATMFFHRFYMRKSMPHERNMASQSSYPFQEMAPTCIFLACKVEETHRKLHSIIEGVMAMLDRSPEGMQRADARMYRVDVNSQEYRRWKNIILLREERLLASLCFDLIVDQPHPVAIKACRLHDTDRELARLVILLLNCFLHGPLCTFYDAATLAAAAFNKACQYIDKNPQDFAAKCHWTDAFDVDQDEVDEAMPDVDEHLEYHHARIQQQRIEPRPATSNAKPSNAATPSAHHQTSAPLERARDGDVGGTPGNGQDVQSESTPSRGKRTHFAEGEHELRSEGSSSHYIVSPRLDDNRGATGPHYTPRPNDWSDRSDSFAGTLVRPASRHGAREGLRGPPPPMSQGFGARMGTSTNASPTRTSEDRWQPGSSNGTDGLSANGHGPQLHRDEISAKVQHEQAQQEKHVLLSPKFARTDEDSEEEGAL